MFRRIVGRGIDKEERAKKLFCLHPSEIRALLELGWNTRVHKKKGNDGALFVGQPNRRSEIAQLPEYFIDALFGSKDANNFSSSNRNDFACASRWDHLIYSYLIENTCVYKIFHKVLFEYLHGEKLGVPTEETQSWLRNTEELFYSNPAPFSIYNVVSHIRPDMEATRRNNYFRMFGMDLNHGNENNSPYKFAKPDGSNRDFVSTFEDFLQEVWTGIINSKNTSGSDRTDDAAIANLARQLHDMLNDRRLNGNISREEFFFVSMMSWFHLTLEFDFPIITSLRAEGTREDQRLYRVADRVGIPAHAKSYDFFQLAEPMSRILIMIETGIFNDEASVPALYNDGDIETDMRTIITHWGYATGRDMKVRRGENVTIARNNYKGYTTSQMPKIKRIGANGSEKAITV
ncbi:hypothetical protein [Aquimarina sp. AU474]|uniref:hypothetical protein n=1 Tax=Aquimarina sp. AU474 TaxID=2108529 RepID=UPI00190F156E|nr:hypothetical protein [Aquimarina sp. AU474]